MSLINEALKKAQRQRHDDPTAPVPPVPGGGTITRRGQPRSAKSLVLISAGAVVLVVLSVVFTVYLVNRAAPPPLKVTNIKPPAPKTGPSPKPIVVPPVAAGNVAPAPAVNSASAITPSPAATRPPKDEGRRPAPLATPTSVEANPTPVAAASIADRPALAPAQPPPPVGPSTPAPSPVPVQTNSIPDPRIHVFVDALRIAGVKAGGAESRVLMNDRVYRLNDIVERSLGVRLIKVETNSLTFSDANSVTYVKFF